MAESWVEIASDIRAAYRPITWSLLRRYYKRDEALREDWVHCPEQSGLATGTSWVTLFDVWLWVPKWASTLSVTLSTKVSNYDAEVKLNLNGTLSAGLTVDWTSYQEDDFTITVVDGDRGARHELLIRAQNSAGPANCMVTLKKLWWSQ